MSMLLLMDALWNGINHIILSSDTNQSTLVVFIMFFDIDLRQIDCLLIDIYVTIDMLLIY